MAFRLHRHVSTVVTDSGMVLLDERTGGYFELNATGAATLTALLDGASPEEATRRLTADTQAPPDQVATDVAAFLADLARLRLGSLT
ncbi:lasso peptide biosynthesis PqqD family chaperone [Streptomyces sp. FH025]|uniref:lasso peptide biosynthesis PqqD family chaperone n=1 Tax=Streptomyces sp. FH025 TaxID=2815937 RepID=UPI001A9DDA96|nr:lasso peptide biosynthesis PqqD family chaperone [Streptomyces sp. FH025]MBO1416829.1 lasso peptide biosynthesis PqqD family chaperone [Streptomyces sp. FH025]